MLRFGLKHTLRLVAARAYAASPHFRAHTAGKVVILMYHRVLPSDETTSSYVQPALFVRPDTFERHLQFLASRFQLLSFQELLARWDADDWDDRARYCTITFDDGWLDNYRYAFPLLRAYGVPATIFLPTSFIGTDRWLWSDRLAHVLQRGSPPPRPDMLDAAIERAKAIPAAERDRLIDFLAGALGEPLPSTRRFVNWAEARAMSAHGIAFGSHTCNHALLTNLDREALDRELRPALEVLRSQDINVIPVLSYPNGNHDAVVVAAARAAGYRAAVTTVAGCECRRPGDLLRLRRIGVHDDVSRSIAELTFHLARQSAQAGHRA